MPFRTRNPYYLRISDKNVLPLYLYLDERHLDWMSDLVLQHVLSDLRPHILPKLKAEADSRLGTGHASSKKATVDTHRGETYQFCYFIRKTEPHSVVVKARNFVAAPSHKKPTMQPPPVPSTLKPRKGKRKGEPAKGPSDNSRKKRKTKGKGKGKVRQTEETTGTSGDDDDDDYSLNQTDNQAPRRSGRTSQNLVGVYREIDDEDEALPGDMADKNTGTVDSFGTLSHNLTRPEQSHAPGMMDVDTPQVRETTEPPPVMEVDLRADEEEEKPKPMLQLRYQGFSIYGHCLCVVVEPWPPIRSMSRASSVVQSLSRAPSIAPPEFVPSGGSGLREKTPLFLPDYESDRERSETPAPFQSRRIPPGPNFDNTSFFDDSDDSDDGGGGMMEFSQVLSASGEFRAGAVDDDEDVDTSVFFGDADEAREL